jgi:hypothetical protein
MKRLFPLLFWVSLALAYGCSSGSPDQDAYLFCQRWVKNELVNPDSAAFPSYQTADIMEGDHGSVESLEASGDLIIQIVGMGRYRIKSFVDSESPSGEIMRTSFICEVRTVAEYGGQGFRLEAFELFE